MEIDNVYLAIGHFADTSAECKTRYQFAETKINKIWNMYIGLTLMLYDMPNYLWLVLIATSSSCTLLSLGHATGLGNKQKAKNSYICILNIRYPFGRSFFYSLLLIKFKLYIDNRTLVFSDAHFICGLCWLPPILLHFIALGHYNRERC